MATHSRMLPAGEAAPPPGHLRPPLSPQPCTPHPEPHNLGLQGDLSPAAAPQNQPKTLMPGREPLSPCGHLAPQQTLCSPRCEGAWGWGSPGARGDGGPSEEPLVLEGDQLSAGRVFFFFFFLALC